MKGQTIIELIIAMALSAVLLPALLTGLAAGRSSRPQTEQRLFATALLKEADEALRIVRENNWASISSNGTYHPQVSGNSWALASGAESINGFTRSIVISDVDRDSNGKIVTSGGTVDPATKKVVSTVSWTSPQSLSVSTTQYLTRYINNTSFVQTTDSDFNVGTLNGTTTTNASGGEVVLGAGGWGNWCNPNLSISALDLPKQGVANAIYAIQGQGFAGTGDNASGVSFANIGISNPPYPSTPSASISGTFDGYKTNDGVFGESNFAYLATDNNHKEIVIVDLTQKDSNNKYAEAGYFDAPGNGSGQSVYVAGNIGFMVTGNMLYTFDLTSKSGSRPRIGSVELAAPATRIIVSGSYAYVSLNSATVQMQIISWSNGGAGLSIVGQASLNGNAARSLFINTSATRAYIVTGSSASLKELFIVDISTKTGSLPTIGSYDTNGMDPKGITAVPGNKIIAVGTGGEEYQVIDVTNEASPGRCGGLNIDSGVNGVSGVLEDDGDAYAYIITGDSSAEFKIIEGGPGGQYSLSGTFESGTMASPSVNSPSQILLNHFLANIAQPANTTLKMQIAAGNALNGSCTGAVFNYAGPDLTAGTYFTSSDNQTISGTIPLSSGGNYLNPAYCYRYKAWFTTTDKNASPVLYDITTNFSP